MKWCGDHHPLLSHSIRLSHYSTTQPSISQVDQNSSTIDHRQHDLFFHNFNSKLTTTGFFFFRRWLQRHRSQAAGFVVLARCCLPSVSPSPPSDADDIAILEKTSRTSFSSFSNLSHSIVDSSSISYAFIRASSPPTALLARISISCFESIVWFSRASFSSSSSFASLSSSTVFSSLHDLKFRDAPCSTA